MLPSEQATARLAAALIAAYGEDDALPAAAERAAAMERIGNAEAARVWAEVTALLARRQGREGRGRA
jgi:hypothetical protein